MKVIYLAAGKAILNNDFTVYNDLFIDRDIKKDMLKIDLNDYDVLIATPPCNYYSRANYRRNISKYSLNTKHLLPCIIDKFILTGKPFIVENVLNKNLMKDIILSLPPDVKYIEYGRHSYFTNILGYVPNVPQKQDFKYGGYFINKGSDKQGGNNVNAVIDEFIEYVKEVILYE